jgi:hypothetical protein
VVRPTVLRPRRPSGEERVADHEAHEAATAAANNQLRII